MGSLFQIIRSGQCCDDIKFASVSVKEDFMLMSFICRRVDHMTRRVTTGMIYNGPLLGRFIILLVLSYHFGYHHQLSVTMTPLQKTGADCLR
jgi:hypothetical protein